ncbi:3-deoxy-7-phosphoheptulonate synthase [Gammaproteobacteria bacterium]|jgi:3-deoxy-7-phosphoheptulonate synthase|nr:3-deoxy-7-phosphoheptulonate synthase [Gammaproteobacteria bacterium]MDB9997850.1 3-deoxy-7-phosphoheptulonate synthase [bacterium]MDA7844279.1 3-deoxy-7-phosphoheptulonate synthase [Gammaproteobacteria bacterium]MDA8934041.1 3-deoxy-7-phosphoheptulonate synthase [Gammaproteobacteria bacterium]MDA9040066.1 3-deoxy-7-phosphoheptulonate synthase [Gammaproteobacteria bacterium]|tara:strand:- start:823 stop:1872 length:1050 start_codon:yes stop_codon:yes gene_type:complete
MNYLTDNTRIIDRQKVPAPYELINNLPLTEKISKLVYGTRNEISQILHDKDDRLLVVVGPCSIHDPKSAIEYGKKLIEENIKFKEDLLIVMRVYFEKPRTTVGWKGLINDPDLDETYKISKGVELARRLLIDLADMGLPAGTEFLDPISPQYITDVISWGAIGARTAESQIHRELASGLSCPIGIKNGTDGSLKAAIDGIQAANHSHVFLGATKEADIAMLKTAGNNDSHIILRGGKEPNFDVESIETTLAALREAEINESIMIDASHGNSQKKFKQQISVVDSISDQICSGNKNINGVMIESHLVEGNQSITDNLTYGQSITDACIGWEDTVKCLETLSAAVQTRRGR